MRSFPHTVTRGQPYLIGRGEASGRLWLSAGRGLCTGARLWLGGLRPRLGPAPWGLCPRWALPRPSWPRQAARRPSPGRPLPVTLLTGGLQEGGVGAGLWAGGTDAALVRASGVREGSRPHPGPLGTDARSPKPPHWCLGARGRHAVRKPKPAQARGRKEKLPEHRELEPEPEREREALACPQLQWPPRRV